MRVHTVTIHITACEGTVDSIRRAHKAQGWSDIGYHWIVDKHGNIFPGRPESKTGAHVGGHNSGNIGISYISRGNDTDSNAPYGKYMTTAQKAGVERITAEVLSRHNLTVKALKGHNEFPGVAKACPCFKVKTAAEFLNNIQTYMGLLKNNKTQEAPEMAEAVEGTDSEPLSDELQAHGAGRDNA